MNIEMTVTITMPINKNEVLTKMTVNEFVDVKIIDKIIIKTFKVVLW